MELWGRGTYVPVGRVGKGKARARWSSDRRVLFARTRLAYSP